MINKLKFKFVSLSVISLFILLTVIITGMNIINYRTVLSEADEVLHILSQNKGRFPEFEQDKPVPDFFSPELPYESRYFSVLLTKSGNPIQIDTSRIISIKKKEAITHAQTVLSENQQSGFIGTYRYLRYNEADTIRITFLDCGRRLASVNAFRSASITMATGGLIVVAAVKFVISGRIIRPIAESYDKQKRFITDAGHEIKTPLTIINANVDVLEMELGDNECLHDIQHQTKRLTDLTNDLVQLAKMEEGEKNFSMIIFPVSDVIQDAVSDFRTLANSYGKNISDNIQPMLEMNGDAKSIEQLVFLLLDNALKYSAEGSNIFVSLTKQNKALVLTVSNKAASAINKNDLERIFDRFYRTDPSRNSETGGHGIGLSMAKAITNAHGGKIYAAIDGDGVFSISAQFPT